MRNASSMWMPVFRSPGHSPSARRRTFAGRRRITRIGRRPKQPVVFWILGVALSLLAGTAFPARAASEENPTVMVTLGQLNREIQLLRGTLSRTMAALEQVKVAANKNADLSVPFNSFNKSWSGLEEQTATVRQHGTAARARAKEHWQAWHAEVTGMQNPKLREKAQKRYAAATKEFEKINEEVADAKE